MKSKYIYAVILDPMIQFYGGRKTTRLLSGGDHSCQCPSCDAMLTFVGNQREADRVVAAFCNHECYQQGVRNFLYVPPVIPSKKTETEIAKLKFCSECRGRCTGKRYKHSSTCSKNPSVIRAQEAAKRRAARGVCPVCGGEAKGRGFSHTPGCSYKTKPVVSETKLSSETKPVETPRMAKKKKKKRRRRSRGLPSGAE